MSNFVEKTNKVSSLSSFFSDNDKDLLTHIEQSIQEYKREKEITQIPVRLFSGKLAAQQVIIKYLHEKGLIYAEIGRLLNRNQKTVWVIYSKAIKKQKEPFLTKKDDLLVEIKIFRTRQSPLKTLILHLQQKGHSRKQIASMLNRSYKNIWMISNE